MKQYQIMINGIPFSSALNEIDAFRIYEANKYCVKNIELIELCPETTSPSPPPAKAEPIQIACSDNEK
ncbi:hypothetical protein ACFQI7_15050 [Paenibacillus allorhizosphaerae]|uniref:Phage protein n=1 Tax=Paenibacillus allorhizosphaerae TaxID=2849866 RepID=A0ABM8VDJ8_9BACL|nr:hypothetical protein [Paenibacillus allorhizosphaerae]CAG7627818.1 hypothetical protein PAECIP111802_01392 [Paenibacillus allorhizosphaerae]